MAQSLIWLGTYHFTEDTHQALSFFKKALPLLMQAKTSDWEAVCTAAIDLVFICGGCLPHQLKQLH